MKNSNVVIICATVLSGITLVTGVALAAFSPTDADLGVFLAVGGNLVVNLLGVGRTQQVASTVDDLANGKMDAKIRAGVADVLADHLVDPKAKTLVEQDRAVRGHH